MDFELRSSISQDIVVAGGGDKSYEVFNCYTQKWTLHKDTLFFDHDDAFSFSYGEKIAICGGTDTNRVEYLNITNNRFASTCRVQLPGTDCGKGVLCGDKILTFGQTSVLATSLKSPFKTTVLFAYKEGTKLSSHGVARVNENAIAIVGGYNFKSKNETSDRVFMFNPITKRLTRLAPLPYGIAEAAVLVYKDNLVILGGTRSYNLDSPTGARFLKTESLNDVLMYNITEQQCRKMPRMVEKRYIFFNVFKLLFMKKIQKKSIFNEVYMHIKNSPDLHKPFPRFFSQNHFVLNKFLKHNC